MGELAEHMPAEPMNIGQSHGLVYCMRCGYLLESPKRGKTAASERSCRRVSIGYR